MSRSPDSSVTKFQPDILIQRDFKEPDCSESEDFLDILSVQTVTGYICHGTSKTKFFVISICKGIVGILFFYFLELAEFMDLSKFHLNTLLWILQSSKCRLIFKSQEINTGNL